MAWPRLDLETGFILALRPGVPFRVRYRAREVPACAQQCTSAAGCPHIVKMKLCSYCIGNVLQSQESWNYHHPSYKSLEEHHQWGSGSVGNAAENKSKKEGCLFCWTLHQDLEKLAPELKKGRNSGAWPVYRWNIRKLSKIRESLETVVVTFRYVPPELVEGRIPVPKDFVEVELPTRTFFLFPEEGILSFVSFNFVRNTLVISISQIVHS